MLNFASLIQKKKNFRWMILIKQILGQNITGGKGTIAYFLKAFGAKRKKSMNKKKVVSFFY